MRDYSLTHLSDDVLLRDLTVLIAQEHGTFAAVLAHLAEVDARRLYAPLGYASMYAYCVGKLRLSEDAAYKRIQAARAARRFPILFTELAEGRLHMTAVCMLAPYLTPENVEELVHASAYRRKSEIEDILACCLGSGGSRGVQGELAPEHGEGPDLELAPEQVLGSGELPSPEQNGAGVAGPGDPLLAPEQVAGSGASLRLAPEQVGEGSVLAQIETLVPLMVRPQTRDRVRYLQALLSHAIPSGDISQVLDRALDLLTEQVERRRFGSGRGIQRRRREGTQYIPAEIRRAVWERDRGRCTFVGTDGHRCNSERYLEFDHVVPRARHPEATVEGLRLRCRTHNQYEAERIFGTEFMARKREEARRRAMEARKSAEESRKSAQEPRESAEEERDRAAKAAELEEQMKDVLEALRGLGIRGEQARRAAARAEALPDATLVDRIRAALQHHGECVMRSPRVARALYASG
jgi:5-methylcytosine-specific restriction endonuclease McrA